MRFSVAALPKILAPSPPQPMSRLFAVEVSCLPAGELRSVAYERSSSRKPAATNRSRVCNPSENRPYT